MPTSTQQGGVGIFVQLQMKGLMRMSPGNSDKYPDYPKSYPKFMAKGFEDDIFVEYIIYCPNCGSDRLIKAGKDANGEQRMKCKRCNHRFKYNTHMNESAFLLRLMYYYHKGYSAKKIAKELEIHTSTITKYTEKCCHIMKHIFAHVMKERE